MKFTKVQGAGNDFVLVETADVGRDWAQIAVAMCDRHFGVGADGLLLVLPSSVADFKMRVFNPDGSEAETCGNGLRCVAKYAVEKGLVNNGAQEILIETMSGVREAKLYKTGNKLDRIQVSMGVPKFGAKEIPIVEQGKKDLLDIKPILDYPVTVKGKRLLLNLVSMGNPHAVYFSPRSVSGFPLSEIGPEVERLAIFPDRINFEVAYVMPVPLPQVEARVWERGAGETLACGSGACAIAVAAQLHGYIDSDKVDIKLPGGILEVEWDGAGEVFLSGSAEIIFTGEWLDESITTS